MKKKMSWKLVSWKVLGQWVILTAISTLITVPAWAGPGNGNFDLSWSSQARRELGRSGEADNLILTLRGMIPPKMQDVIGRKIELEFGRADDFAPIQWRSCQDRSLRDENLARLADPQDWMGAGILDRKIILNPEFEETVLHGFDKPRGSCRHGDDYNLLLGSVFNQIARAYDRMSNSDPALLKAAARCTEEEGYTSEGTASPISAECDRIEHTDTLVSERVPFMHLMKFYSTPFGTYSKQRADAPKEDDPRLSSNPKDAFAAATEDFLVDPSFYCAHPGIYEFLASRLGVRPPVGCKPDFRVKRSDAPSYTITLDPKRVYRIDYLYVHPGKKSGLISLFGHAMLRVIACAPNRAQPGPDCLEDKAYHYILTFYGKTVRDNTVARLMVYGEHSLFSDYIEGADHRVIEDVPLSLKPEEIATLIGTAWEWNKGYRGRWYDLTNNCVTHTLDLLHAAVPRLEFSEFSLVTPGRVGGLLEELPGIGNPHYFIKRVP